MTAAVLRSSPNLAVPQTQNTAPVFEFNCLYTHDLRRKQKRWQDGFLRYHTFNKRVMVYDVPRNFLGDLHWTSGDDLQEGDEMTLEKGGIMVEVSERIGTIQNTCSTNNRAPWNSAFSCSVGHPQNSTWNLQDADETQVTQCSAWKVKATHREGLFAYRISI